MREGFIMGYYKLNNEERDEMVVDV